MANLDAVISQIVADIEALVPATRPTLRYYCLDTSLTTREGPTSDRGFSFTLPSAEVVSLRGAVSETKWDFSLVVMLSESSASPHAFRSTVVNEATAIRSAIDARSSWPAGTIQVVTRGFDITVDDETRDVQVAIALTVLTEES